MSNEQDKQNRPKDTRKGAEYWGLPAVFTGANDECKDFTTDEQYMKDNPEDKDYRDRIAAGKTHCFDCLWESDNKCVHAKCHTTVNNNCLGCGCDVGEGVRSGGWSNCPYCGAELDYGDFVPKPPDGFIDKAEQCEHKRLYIKFAWAQNLEAESEWSSIFGVASKTYHLRMTKGGEWQNHSWQQDSIHVRRVVCLDCNELLYDRGSDSWGIVPECLRQIINDSAEKFMSKNFANMKKDGFVIVYTTKEHIAQWDNVKEADRVK